jgi:hypothetical protein
MYRRGQRQVAGESDGRHKEREQLMTTVPLLFGLIFAPLAALMAFLVTYGEYAHHYSNRKKPLRLAIESAVVSFIVVGVLVWAASLLFPKL